MNNDILELSFSDLITYLNSTAYVNITVSFFTFFFFSTFLEEKFQNFLLKK